MTWDELMELTRSGDVRFDLLIWDALAEKHCLQYTIKSREILTEAFSAAIREHQVGLMECIQLNSVDVCLSPEEHRASWSWVPVPPHMKPLDSDYERCEMCVEYRRTAHLKPPGEVITR